MSPAGWSGGSVPYFPLRLTEANGQWTTASPHDASTYVLDRQARDLLALCDGVNTYADVIAGIRSRYRLAEEDGDRPVAAALGRLTGAGLVWWRDRPMVPMPVAPPTSVFWELTWRCNLRCVHCVVSGGERMPGELTTKELRGIAWQLARAGVRSVTYSGGEPLCRPDFLEIAEHVASLGMSAQIATNGHYVTPELAGHLARLGISAQITLNGATAGPHDTFTGIRGSWDRAVAAIRLLVADGTPVVVATVATRLSESDVPTIVDLAIGLGAQAYRLIPFVPGGRGRIHRDLELEPSEMRRLTVVLREVRAAGRISILPLEFEETLGPTPTGGCPPNTRIGCDGAITYCTIGPSGEVLPCSFFNGVAADSVRDRPFDWIWRNSRFLNYFRSLTVADITGRCSECEYLAWCRGGCRATNNVIGRLFESNAHCWLAAG
jgi:radical SAM protein with 4Fe4S-binding SPASM domain